MGTVRVLHFSIGGSTFTGIASFLHQYYRNMDRNAVKFDFVFAGKNSMQLVSEDPIFSDSSFIELHAVTDDLKKYDYAKLIKETKKILSEGKYDILHINTHRVGVNIACIVAAKRAGTKIIISHSHNVRRFIAGKSRKRWLTDIEKAICAIYIRNSCNYLFACSKNAGVALFGKTGVNMEKFKVIKNAIDTSAFVYDETVRYTVREREVVDDNTLILGQIGRLSIQKNQSFSVDVLSELINKGVNAKLWLIGNGEDQAELEQKVVDANVKEYVRFFGQRTDVAQLLQGMDGVLFPSTYEGLGIVAIEAQAAGLPTYASTEIPVETNLTDLISYIPLSDGAQKWAEYIINDISKHERRNTQEDIIKSGYEIKSAAKWLEDFYLNCGN